MATTTKFIRPDFHVIATFNPNHWDILPEHQKYIRSIHEVEFFDKNEETYCCEVTPSYTLYFLENQVRATDLGLELQDTDPELWDEIRDFYEDQPQNDMLAYYHCHSIDKLIETLPVGDYHHYGDPNPSLKVKEYREWLTEVDLIDAVREDLRSNSVI